MKDVGDGEDARVEELLWSWSRWEQGAVEMQAGGPCGADAGEFGLAIMFPRCHLPSFLVKSLLHQGNCCLSPLTALALKPLQRPTASFAAIIAIRSPRRSSDKPERWCVRSTVSLPPSTRHHYEHAQGLDTDLPGCSLSFDHTILWVRYLPLAKAVRRPAIVEPPP